MRCLDTDIMIAFLRSEKNAVSKIEKLSEEGIVATTTINAFELLVGARVSKKETEREDALKLLTRLKTFQLNIENADTGSKIFADLLSKGEVLEFRDILIASVAMSNNLILVTRNLRHFSRIKELKIETW